MRAMREPRRGKGDKFEKKPKADQRPSGSETSTTAGGKRRRKKRKVRESRLRGPVVRMIDVNSPTRCPLAMRYLKLPCRSRAFPPSYHLLLLLRLPNVRDLLDFACISRSSDTAAATSLFLDGHGHLPVTTTYLRLCLPVRAI